MSHRLNEKVLNPNLLNKYNIIRQYTYYFIIGITIFTSYYFINNKKEGLRLQDLYSNRVGTVLNCVEKGNDLTDSLIDSQVRSGLPCLSTSAAFRVLECMQNCWEYAYTSIAFFHRPCKGFRRAKISKNSIRKKAGTNTLFCVNCTLCICTCV